MRSTAANGIALRFCEAAPSTGEPATRRPSSSSRVYCEARPRRLMVACDCAELPELCWNEPKVLKVAERRASATDRSPDSCRSSRLITVIGVGPSMSTRLMREPVTSMRSSVEASSASCAAAVPIAALASAAAGQCGANAPRQQSYPRHAVFSRVLDGTRFETVS